MARDLTHPVWSVYDRLRTARLNVKYYGQRLEFVQRVNVAAEIVLFATAPSSAVAGLWFWGTPSGRVVWSTLGVIAAVVASLQPFLRLPAKIRKYEGLVTGYRVLEYDLQALRTEIEQRRKYEGAHQKELKQAIMKERELVSREPLESPNRRLLARCEDEVLREMPSEAFFVPEE